jgi:hypothetical protein
MEEIEVQDDLGGVPRGFQFSIISTLQSPETWRKKSRYPLPPIYVANRYRKFAGHSSIARFSAAMLNGHNALTADFLRRVKSLPCALT